MAICQVDLAAAHPVSQAVVMTRSNSGTRLATRLPVARAERRVSQTELAAMVGVSRQTISSIETGQYTPSALLAFRLAAALGMPIDELFHLEGGDR